MSIIQGSAMQGASRGFYPKTIEGSLRFNDDDSPYLSWTGQGGVSERRTFTISCWVKKAKNGSQIEIFGTASEGDNLYFTSGDQLGFFQNGSADAYIISTAKFRDPSAWYHIVCAVDTTQAVASNRVKLYVNGEEITSFSSSTYPSQNNASFINNTVTNFLGKGHGDNEFDGYIAEFFMVAGTQHDADDFGEIKNGVWCPKDITASDFTMGTNGFHLTFEDDTEVEAFNTVLWRGDGATTQSVTGTGFSPDLVWLKERNSTSSHQWVDTVRGPRRSLFSNVTNIENESFTYLQSFDSDGFSVGDSGGTNESGNKYVAWCWDAGANNASTGHSSVTYKGNGGTQRISGLPFTPDLVWIKDRDAANHHVIVDSVRGGNKQLNSSTIGSEQTQSALTSSLDKDGFVLGSNSAGTGATNIDTNDYVAWAWDAGDGDAVSDTSGTNVSSVTRKTSTANGFSIIDYTVTSSNNSSTKSVPHGLGGNPDWMMIKKRTNNASDNQRWAIYHSALADDQFLKMGDSESTDGASTASSVFDDSAFTDDTFAVGSSGMVGGHPSYDESYICYAWKAVSGKSAFGSYTGTGSDVTKNVGFRPGFLLVKWTGGGGATAENWAIVDASREPFNDLTTALFPDLNNLEQDSANNTVEFTSTGFVVKSTDNRFNANGGTYIYAAFAGSYSDYITDFNTDGTLDSRTKASDTNGFSIVSYQGDGTASRTVGHGLTLSSAPTNYMVIIKSRTISADWQVFHSGADGVRLKLNTNDDDFGNYPITFGTDTITLPSTNSNSWDASGHDYIAYCWTETTDVSKFGSYNGNNSTDGPEIDCGFIPSMVILKRTDADGSWTIYDTTRDTDDTIGIYLYPHLSNNEPTDLDTIRITRTADGDTYDGFKLVRAGTDINGVSTTEYIFAAFADTREAAFWLDQSSNNNDWQPNNLDHNDTVSDSPTDNFCTLNPLQSSAPTYSEGNLRVALADNEEAFGTIAMTSGQWYWEVTYISSASSNNKVAVGIADADNPNNNEVVNYGHQATTYAVGDVIGVAVDVDAETISFYKNGTAIESDTSWSSKNWAAVKPFATSANSAGDEVVQFNFGQQPFKYDPPE